MNADKQLQCGRFNLDLQRAQIMGILNCTPDSFSDGGAYFNTQCALDRAWQMIEEGVDIIDIGAESTRPGSQAITSEREIDRLREVVTTLVAKAGKAISIDTKNAAVMSAMLDIGVDMINDVHALEDEGAVAAVKDSNCAICLMHMRGMPHNMQHDTNYDDVVAEVDNYLVQRAQLCENAGISANRIVLDPGFGFGKTPPQNMALIRENARFANGKYPILIGVSRKSTLGYYLNDAAVNERLFASVVLAALGVWQGAQIVRVHDVKETRQALAIVNALR